MSRWLFGICLALVALGCDPSTATLTVRVQSGLRAGDEIRYVEATLYRGAARCAAPPDALEEGGRALASSDQEALVTGTLTVREHRSLAPGTYTVRVQARRPGPGGPDSGPVLIERCVVTTLSNDRVIRVALTRDCLGVSCPAPDGSPAFDQCLGGRCVDPRCDLDDPSTAELCCDRALLGELCDTEPTLCQDARECDDGPECAGPALCEDGVCVEPVEDQCPDGRYCDALTSMCELDPDRTETDAGLDATVASDAGELDALPSDAPALDGALAADAPTEDAALEIDASSEDASAAIDASGPDASGLPGEDCTARGDEDADGAADCADAECVGSSICTAGCGPLSILPLAPLGTGVPPPTHWYRADLGVLSSGSTVCAIRDLVGTAHFVAVPSTRPVAGHLPMLGTLAGRPALSFDGTADGRMIATSDLGVDADGEYSVVIVARAGTGAGTFLRSWAPESGTELFELPFTELAGVWTHGLEVHGSRFTDGTTDATTRSHEMVRVTALAPGVLMRPSIDISFDRDGARRAITLESGSGRADMHTFTGPTQAVIGPGPGMVIAEILVYSHVLSGSEGSALISYFAMRYP